MRTAVRRNRTANIRIRSRPGDGCSGQARYQLSHRLSNRGHERSVRFDRAIWRTSFGFLRIYYQHSFWNADIQSLRQAHRAGLLHACKLRGPPWVKGCQTGDRRRRAGKLGNATRKHRARSPGAGACARVSRPRLVRYWSRRGQWAFAPEVDVFVSPLYTRKQTCAAQ